VGLRGGRGARRGLAGENPGNYRIDSLPDRSPTTRVKDNIAAIRLAKQIAQEGRYATREEQEALAEHAGWGGPPNSPATGRRGLRVQQRVIATKYHSPWDTRSAPASRPG
jgi:hypothetical protein